MRLGDWSWIWSNEERDEDLKSAYQLCLWETPVGSQGVPAEIKQGTLSLRGKELDIHWRWWKQGMEFTGCPVLQRWGCD